MKENYFIKSILVAFIVSIIFATILPSSSLAASYLLDYSYDLMTYDPGEPAVSDNKSGNLPAGYEFSDTILLPYTSNGAEVQNYSGDFSSNTYPTIHASGIIGWGIPG